MDADAARRLDGLRARVDDLSAQLLGVAEELRALAATAEEPAPPAPLVRVRDVARLLGVSESSVRERIAQGDLPATRFGHAVVIPLDAVQDVQRSATTDRPAKRRLLERRDPLPGPHLGGPRRLQAMRGQHG